MTLYQIDAAIADLVDSDTGEVTDFAALDALAMERDAKCENIALAYKNLAAEAKAIGEEKKALAEREAVAKAKADRCKAYLVRALDGKPLKTPRVSVSWRNNADALEIDDEDRLLGWCELCHDEYVRYSSALDRVAIRTALLDGKDIEGARLVPSRSAVIK